MHLIKEHYLLLVIVVNAVINMLSITTGAARISGVTTQQVATSLTLYNLFQTTFRLLTLFYTPFLGAIVDHEIAHGTADRLEGELRWVIGGATIGSCLGFMLLPSFIELFTRGVRGLEISGSMPGLLVAVARPANLRRLWLSFRRPSLLGVDDFRIGPRPDAGGLSGMPLGFLVYNVFGIAVWTVGVLSAHLASAMVVQHARTALMLSGVVNGFGTIFLFVFVDPVASLMVDQAASKRRPASDVRVMTLYLSVGTVVGTIFAQLLFKPGACWIAWCARLIGQS